MLERRHIAEAEHQDWREQHDQAELECELSEARQRDLEQAREQLQEPSQRMVFKTFETPPPAEPANSEPALGISALNDIADIVGEELDEVRAEIARRARGEYRAARQA